MATPKKSGTSKASNVKSLPKKPATGAVKGGAVMKKRSVRSVRGGDDDLNDLEVER